MRTNYHTHTHFCRHADGTLEDYCRSAADNDVQVLGFCDHCPHPDDLWLVCRMGYDQTDEYFQAIRRAKAAFPQLEVRAGLECEFRPELGSFQKEHFLETPGRCEYLILGQHSYVSCEGDWHSAWNISLDKAVREYTDFVIRAMDTGIYSIVAHPDIIFFHGYPWNAESRACCRALIAAAIDRGLPLEINCKGMRKAKFVDRDEVLRHPYPYGPFWAMAAEMGAKAIIGSDAHSPEEVWCRDNEIARALADFYGLTLIDTIPMWGK